MSTPLTDSINALTQYANEVTGGSDTNLSDAVHTLASGYGGGTLKWKDFSGGNIQAIIGDGASYINTGLYLPHNDIIVGVKFKPNALTAYEYVFGDWSTERNERFSIQKAAGNSTLFTAYPVQPAYSRNVTDIAVFEFGLIGRATSIATSPLLIFKGYYSNKEEAQISKCSFYGLNAVDNNNEYIARIVPWKDDNDVICVRNLVTGENYYNAGTGTFGYIDSNGVEHV